MSKSMEDIDNLGYTELVLKGDGEPALVQVMNEVKRQKNLESGRLAHGLE